MHPLEQMFGDAQHLAPNALFSKMVTAAHKRGEPSRFLEKILALDPGETTGVAAWDPDANEILLWQLETKDLGPSYDVLLSALNSWAPSHLRAEDYKVYGWKANEHAFASLHTPRWLGAIEVAAYVAGIPFSVKLAQHAKTWWTDDKLKACAAYHPGMKHARDAKRHLSFYMAFGPN